MLVQASQDALRHLEIIMVGTKFPENIGMAARACANTGCGRLTLVNPVWWDREKARPLATAKGEPGRGLTWEQLREMLESGLCSVGNHTHDHVRPEQLTAADLDACTAAVEQHLGVRPRHFTYPWGVVVPGMEDALRARFRSASTGELGRNLPGVDLMRLRRVPVRRTDPDEFFAAKLRGGLLPERLYAWIVAGAKRLRLGG